MKTLCKVCQNPTHLFTHPKFGTYDCCDFCDFISKHKEDYVSPEVALETYNLHQNTIDDPRYVAYFTAFIEQAILPFSGAERDGFDFGSGPEAVLAQILESQYDYKMDHYDYFFSPNTNYLGKKYHLITSTEVIEHLEDPIAQFEHFKAHLDTDGILAIMTTFHPKDLQSFNNWHYMRDMTHISFFTPQTLGYIAQLIGLKVLYTDNKRYITFCHL